MPLPRDKKPASKKRLPSSSSSSQKSESNTSETDDIDPVERMKRVVKLSEEELDKMLDADFLADKAINFVEMDHNSHIFRHAALRRFLTH